MNTDGAHTIFIADDNPENLDVLSDMLEREGYRTRASLSGEEMLRSIKIQQPDLIILDIHMPQMDGYEVCKSLKASAEFQDIPVIFCSALNDMFNIVKAFDVGGVDYITKPFRRQEVLARIKTHITLRKKEHALRESMQQMESIQTHLIQTEKLTSLGVLVAGIAHEINNPINYIINSLQGFQRDFEEIQKLLEDCGEGRAVGEKIDPTQYPLLLEEMRALLDGIHTGADKIHSVVKSLKVFSSQQDTAETQEISVKTAVDRAFSLVRSQLPAEVSLTQDIPELPPIHLPPGELSRILLSLLTNALDAIKETLPAENTKNEISVSAELVQRSDSADSRADDSVVIKVIDSGPGMSKTVLSRARDPFYTTKKVGDATGLGLSLCHQLTVKFGGTLDLESTPNKGTTVTLTFPTGSHRRR